MIKSTNFITHKIEIKIIEAIIEKQVAPQFWPVVYIKFKNISNRIRVYEYIRKKLAASTKN